MEYSFLSQKEFADMYKSGRRVFSNILLNFFDIGGMKFDGMVISDSKLLFCTFRNCDFSNVTLKNCVIFFGSFYTGRISNMLFERCDMELTLFENIIFDASKLDKCNIRYCGIFNSNAASVDFSSSSCSKLFTDVSQITPEDVEAIVSMSMASIDRLDLNQKRMIKEIISADSKRYNFYVPGFEKSGRYERNVQESSVNITYGEVRSLVESVFGAYSHEGGGYKMNKKDGDGADAYR